MNRLKELRKQKGVTQQKVSMDLNISRESISHYETGRDDIPNDLLIVFARYYRTTIDNILCFDPEDPNS